METSEVVPEDETEGQKAARLRRERRNAKILAGGSERLNKITSLSGRPAVAEIDLAQSSPATSTRPPQPQSRPNGTHNDDPEEVDISQMFRRDPGTVPLGNQDAFLRQMLGVPSDQAQAEAFPNQQIPAAEDPMAQMMQQMQQMFGGPGVAGDAGGGGLPPGLADMLGGQGQAKPSNPMDYIWKIVHAIFALILGLYAAIRLPFVGTEEARFDVMHVQNAQGAQLFWIFATTELILQSTRYVLDHGQLPPSGILYTVGSFLPEPYAGYIRTFGRYSIIWTTIVSDAMVVVFILGCLAWWQSLTITL